VRLPEADGVIDLHSEFVQSREPHRLYDLGPVLVVKASLSRRITVAKARASAERALAGMAVVVDVAQNSNKTTLTVTVRPFKQHRATVREVLSRWRPGD
jgi:hypothetical protein